MRSIHPTSRRLGRNMVLFREILTCAGDLKRYRMLSISPGSINIVMVSSVKPELIKTPVSCIEAISGIMLEKKPVPNIIITPKVEKRTPRVRMKMRAITKKVIRG